MGSPILPPLPTTLANYKKPAQSVTELVSHLRSRSNGSNPPEAESLERHQTYLDALNNGQTAIVSYLQAASNSTSTPTSPDNNVTINGVPVIY
jgi:hypothetical protein